MGNEDDVIAADSMEQLQEILNDTVQDGTIVTVLIGEEKSEK